MTQADLEALAVEWRKTLRLQDWNVLVKLRRIFDLSKGGILGECTWVLTNRSALIGVLDPADYDPMYPNPFDPEQVLVHELVHLHFAPFCPIGEETYQHEQAIDALAMALVDAKRGSTPTAGAPAPQAPGERRYQVGDLVRWRAGCIATGPGCEDKAKLRGRVAAVNGDFGEVVSVAWGCTARVDKDGETVLVEWPEPQRPVTSCRAAELCRWFPNGLFPDRS